MFLTQAFTGLSESVMIDPTHWNVFIRISIFEAAKAARFFFDKIQRSANVPIRLQPGRILPRWLAFLENRHKGEIVGQRSSWSYQMIMYYASPLRML